MRHDQDERRQRKVKIIIGVFIVAVMVLSTFGFVLDYASTSGVTERVGGIAFRQSSNGVVARIEGVTMTFNYFPSQIRTIPAEGRIKDILRDTPALYITSDPTDPYAKDIDEVSLYLSTVLPETKQIYVAPGFTNATGYARPQITCDNATAYAPVIYFFRANQTGLSVQDNCVLAAAQVPNDVYRLNERLLLLMLGVLDE